MATARVTASASRRNTSMTVRSGGWAIAQLYHDSAASTSPCARGRNGRRYAVVVPKEVRMAPSVGVPTGPPGGPDWLSLVALWQFAGQTLLVRLQSLEQIGAWSGSLSRDVAAYDVAVEEYLSQVRASWLETRSRWPQAVPVAPPDLVESLIPDPGSPPAMVFFAGFQGRSTSEDQVRFYLDAELSSFVDVAREDVLYTRPMPPAQAPLGGYYVWARRD